MGILVDGQWSEEELATETDTTGAFQRSDSRLRDWITPMVRRDSRPNPGAIISMWHITARGLIAR